MFPKPISWLGMEKQNLTTKPHIQQSSPMTSRLEMEWAYSGFGA